MLACLTLLFLGVGLGHLFHLYTEKNRDPEKCTAPVIVFYNNTQANLYVFAEKTHWGGFHQRNILRR